MPDFQIAQAYDTVNLLRDGPAAVVELARPDSLNAWNRPLTNDVVAALEACAAPDVRAVLVTGQGRGFSSGADLRSFADPDLPRTEDGRVDLERELVAQYLPIFRAIRALEKPVLAGVNGPAAGVGMSLALACDLVTISEAGGLAHAFTRIGLGPDGGASLWLVARLGWTRAAGIMHGGLNVGAEEAVRIGLANASLPAEGFRAAIEDEVRGLAAGPTLAHRAIKLAVNQRVLPGFEELFALESRLQGELGRSEDFQTAAMAVLQKQAPEFSGR